MPGLAELERTTYNGDDVVGGWPRRLIDKKVSVLQRSGSSVLIL